MWIRGQAFLGISINLKSEIGVMTRSQDLLKPRSVSVLGVKLLALKNHRISYSMLAAEVFYSIFSFRANR